MSDPTADQVRQVVAETLPPAPCLENPTRLVFYGREEGSKDVQKLGPVDAITVAQVDALLASGWVTEDTPPPFWSDFDVVEPAPPVPEVPAEAPPVVHDVDPAAIEKPTSKRSRAATSTKKD